MSRESSFDHWETVWSIHELPASGAYAAAFAEKCDHAGTADKDVGCKIKSTDANLGQSMKREWQKMQT
jgi:hypothetical protein